MATMKGARIGTFVVAALLATLVMVTLSLSGVGIPSVVAGVGLISIFLYVAFWAAVIAGGIWLARELGLLDGGRRLRHDDAVLEVRRRYARGEISRTEYFQMLEDLVPDSDPDRHRL